MAQGFLTDYYTADPTDCGTSERDNSPAILLVHGFGAFGEQWRGQIRPLARAGYKVGLRFIMTHILESMGATQAIR